MTLCDDAFEMMKDGDFKNTLDRLTKANYIQNSVDKTFIDHVTLDKFTTVLTAEYKEVERKYSGYEITTEGVLAFRRQIKIPIQKIMAHVDKFSRIYVEPQKASKYSEIINTLKQSSDLGNSVADLAIKNSPLFGEFIVWAKDGLKALGIDIPF